MLFRSPPSRPWWGYHGLVRRYLMPPRFLMRPMLNGGTLGGPGEMPQPCMHALTPERLQGSVERSVRLCAALLVLGCSGRTDLPREPMPTERTAKVVKTEELSLPLPHGYRDKTAQLSKAGTVLVFVATVSSDSYRPTITLVKVPIPGGSFADSATCAQTGSGLVRGGTDGPGTGGVLKSAAIIDGPVGRTCQIHLVAPEGIAVITELHRPANTPQSPKDVWLMTCNYANGNDAAEAACRSTLAGFRFRHP